MRLYLATPLITGSTLFLLVLGLAARTGQTATLDETSPSEPPTVAFCDLVGNPSRYDAKVVRTEAIVAAGFEVAIVYDAKCDDRNKRAWYTFDQSSYQPDEKGWKSLRELLFASKERAGHYFGRARATMVGRMDASDKNGYGHLNQYHYQFTIMRVERAEAVPSDVPE